jgi:hypothetical protein
MSAILHCIITGIENQRIKKNIMEWRNKYIIDRPFQTLEEIEGVVENNLNKTWNNCEEYEETEDGIEEFFSHRCNNYEDINYLFGNKAKNFDKIKPRLVLQILDYTLNKNIDMMGDNEMFVYSGVINPDGDLEDLKTYLVYWIGMEWRSKKIHYLLYSDEESSDEESSDED